MPADLTGVNWDDCALEKITEMVSRRVYADRKAGVTIVQTELRKGALVAQHTHAGEQSIQVMQGSIVVTLNGAEISPRSRGVRDRPSGRAAPGRGSRRFGGCGRP
jgi:quercetin dioxygenase-like cupin family protein